MSLKKEWHELPPHTYERYVAWCAAGRLEAVDYERWQNYDPEPDSILRVAKANCYPLFKEATSTPKSAANLRADFLDVVKGYVTKDRNATHGDAEDNFADIAGLINIALSKKLKEPLAPVDVATIMICVKLSRIKTTPDNLDHWHDTAGYAACGGGIVMRNKE
jgi:hypothetical protein